MDEQVVDKVKEKLEKYYIADYEKLNDKEKQRLYKIELLLQENNERYNKLADEIKQLKLSKVKIANSKEIGLSRKTLYNDKVVQKFIEISIKEQDFKNENDKLYDLQNKYKDLKEQYTKVLKNIVEINLLYEKFEQYEEKILILTEQNENLKSIIYEQNSKSRLNKSYTIVK